MASRPVCTSGVMLVDHGIDNGVVAETLLELCNIGDLSAISGDVTKVVERRVHLNKIII